MNLCTVSPERIRQIIEAYQEDRPIVALPNEVRGARRIALVNAETCEAAGDLLGWVEWSMMAGDLKRQLDGQGQA